MLGFYGRRGLEIKGNNGKSKVHRSKRASIQPLQVFPWWTFQMNNDSMRMIRAKEGNLFPDAGDEGFDLTHKLTVVNTLGNLVWLVFGGFVTALGYVVGGAILCFTIVGIPFGLQCFKLAEFILWPFGRMAVSTPSSGGCLATVLNLVWLVFGGFWIAIAHLVFGMLLCITIIGIPFGRQHFKLIEISLMPFGKTIVDKP
jgi:uncharacterized membrane protein YccF (DUF307 family)